MESVARIYVVRELRQAGQKAEYIAERVGVDRATVYRWLRGIRQRGIKGFVRGYKQAKKGHRHRKTHSYIEQRVLAIRREHHECCGEKIVYWLAKEGIELSRSIGQAIGQAVLVTADQQGLLDTLAILAQGPHLACSEVGFEDAPGIRAQAD